MTQPALCQLDGCALASVTSPQMLAERLSTTLRPVSVEDLEACTDGSARISSQNGATADNSTNEGPQPDQRLQDVHGRIHDLLSQLTLPPYAQPVRDRLPDLTTTPPFRAPPQAAPLDTWRFDPCVTDTAVADFFERRMQCSNDVAALLARLLTVDSHLPTGSHASPIVSFLINQQTYDEIALFAENKGLEMKLWVDSCHLSIDVGSPRPTPK